MGVGCVVETIACGKNDLIGILHLDKEGCEWTINTKGGEPLGFPECMFFAGIHKSVFKKFILSTLEEGESKPVFRLYPGL